MDIGLHIRPPVGSLGSFPLGHCLIPAIFAIFATMLVKGRMGDEFLAFS